MTGRQPDMPRAKGKVNKALFVLQMNFWKKQVRNETKIMHLRQLRNACAEYVAEFDRMYD